MSQSDFKNSDKDQIIQEVILITVQCGTDQDLPEKEIWERDKESKAILKMKQSQEVQDLLRA